MAVQYLFPVVRLGAILILLAGAQGAVAQETNPVKLLKGTIKNVRSGGPIDAGGKVLAFVGSAKEAFTSSKINPKTGAYQMILSPSTEYRLQIESPSFETTEFPYTSPSGSNYEESMKDMAVEPIDIGAVMYSGRIFEPNSAALINDPAFQKAIDKLRAKGAITVTIGIVPDGIYDAPKAAPKPKKGKKAVETTPAPTTGTPEQALEALGAERLQVIRDMLRSQKISTTRVKIELLPARKLARPARGKAPKLEPNVQMKITGFSAYEDDDES